MNEFYLLTLSEMREVVECFLTGKPKDDSLSALADKLLSYGIPVSTLYSEIERKELDDVWAFKEMNHEIEQSHWMELHDNLPMLFSSDEEDAFFSAPVQYDELPDHLLDYESVKEEGRKDEIERNSFIKDDVDLQALSDKITNVIDRTMFTIFSDMVTLLGDDYSLNCDVDETLTCRTIYECTPALFQKCILYRGRQLPIVMWDHTPVTLTADTSVLSGFLSGSFYRSDDSPCVSFDVNGHHLCVGDGMLSPVVAEMDYPIYYYTSYSNNSFKTDYVGSDTRSIRRVSNLIRPDTYRFVSGGFSFLVYLSRPFPPYFIGNLTIDLSSNPYALKTYPHIESFEEVSPINLLLAGGTSFAVPLTKYFSTTDRKYSLYGGILRYG